MQIRILFIALSLCLWPYVQLSAQEIYYDLYDLRKINSGVIESQQLLLTGASFGSYVNLPGSPRQHNVGVYLPTTKSFSIGVNYYRNTIGIHINHSFQLSIPILLLNKGSHQVRITPEYWNYHFISDYTNVPLSSLPTGVSGRLVSLANDLAFTVNYRYKNSFLSVSAKNISQFNQPSIEVNSLTNRGYYPRGFWETNRYYLVTLGSTYKFNYLSLQPTFIYQKNSNDIPVYHAGLLFNLLDRFYFGFQSLSTFEEISFSGGILFKKRIRLIYEHLTETGERRNIAPDFRKLTIQYLL